VTGVPLKDAPHELRAFLLIKNKHLLHKSIIKQCEDNGWFEPVLLEEK